MNKTMQALVDAFATMVRKKTKVYVDVPEHSKADPRERGKTRRGAIHKHGSVFLGRQILPMTPAQYRHNHIAAKKKDSKS